MNPAIAELLSADGVEAGDPAAADAAGVSGPGGQSAARPGKGGLAD
jgi:hypothetical protein